MRERYQKMTKERNSLQQKVFEMQSEFCSVEIERDLEKETSRYLEEQVSSLNSSLLLKENELVSLRKRYKLLNEGFLNSETLREGLERDVSELTKIITELEERLEVSEGMLKDKDKLEVKTTELTAENTEEKAKLEAEVTTLNESLKKERNSKTNIEEMFANVEEERSLLLKEVEDLRSEHQKQVNEVNVLRDLLHDKNKQEQLHHLQEQQLQRQLGEKQEQSEVIAELQETKIQLSNKISLLENENKKLEDELDQQLAVLEKLEAENNSLTEARKEIEEISDKLKFLGSENIEQLIAEYSMLQESKCELERKVKQLEHEISVCQISKEKVELSCNVAPKDCLHLEVNSTKSCVPRSEYLKLKFQLKSLTEEMKTLKQTSESKNLKQRRSRKHENSMAKKWLKTMKDGINAVNEDDFAGERCSAVLLETKLHEANIHAEALQHELEISRKENEALVSVNRKREGEIEVLKRQLVESQVTQNSLLKETKMKLQSSEKKLEDEVQKGIKMEEKNAYLEDHNQEMCIELEKIKEKFQSLQKEKERTQNELESFKNDILKNFGSLSIQSVCDSLTVVKEKSVEYVKIIETNKSNLAKLSQELNSLQQVNTVLREELNDARIQLEKKDEEISKKYLSDSIKEKRESDRLQAVMQALESSKQNEAELLAMYTKEKREWERLHEEVMKLNSELQETKILLLEKEKECETTNRIMQELEATCEVYEVEFEKSAKAQERNAKEDRLSSDESQDDELSESGSDSTAENLREMQEALQERMAAKVKRLQNRLEETLAALSSCQKLNVDLQQKLHDAEKKNSEKDQVDGKTPDKEFLETILNKLSEKEREIQEILEADSSGPEGGKQENRTENNLDELLSPYKVTIKQLKIDNAKNEVHLAEANERIAALEEKLATYQNFPEDRTQILDCSNHSTFENVSITMTSKEDVNETDNVVATNDDLKEELDSMTAKYVNLKAAFEGCLRRLKNVEGGEDAVETGTAGTVNIVERYRSSDVTEEVVVPKFISPLQGKKTKTVEVQTGFQETRNSENYLDTQAIKSSPLSEISCAFIESDVDSDSIGSDRMVIELTFTENNMDSLEIPETSEELLYARLDYENEFGRLRANIIELEKLNSTTTSEIHRVKQCAFKEKTDLENKLGSSQKLNSMMKTKLAAVEMERDSLEERVNQLDIRLSDTKQELQRIKISSLKEQEISENTVKVLKDQENTLKKRIVTLEREKDELRLKIEELQGNLRECSVETERVKIDSHNQDENYKNVFNKFEREIEVYKKEKESYDLKISELKQNVCVLDDEIQKSKEENLKHKESIRKSEGVIWNLEKQNTDLKCDKEDAFRKNGELEHGNEILIKNHELSMASILKEKEGLEKKVLHLQTTTTTLEETLGREKATNDGLTCKIRTENEECEIRLLSERKTFEETRKHLQEKIMILEKEIEDLNFGKNNLESTVKELEVKIGLLNEENDRRMTALLGEKQSFADTSKESQIMITELKEKFMVENMEKENKISLIQNENLSLKVEKEKLESQVLSCVDEIQRIKSLSFNGREKLEAIVKILQETKVSMENVVAEDKQAIEQLNSVRNDFESKCLYLVKELERVKICSFNENQLEDKIGKLTEALSSIETKFEDLNVEKDHLVLKEKELDHVIWKLQEELQRVKVCAFEERQNIMAKAESYNVLVQDSKTNFEYQTLERDRQISSLKLTVSELSGLSETLESEKHIQHEEICAFKIDVENLQNEINRLEKNVTDYECQISTLRNNLSELDEDKRSLATKVLQRDAELSSVKIMVDELQNEKKQLQEKIVERGEQVSLLELNATRLDEQTSALENNLLQSAKEKSTLQILVANLEKQKKLLKDDIISCNSEIALLKRKVSQLEEERECFATSLAEKDRELSEFRITVGKLENEKNGLKESNVKQSNEVSLLKTNVAQLHEDLRSSINVKDGELSDTRIVLEKLENKRNALKEDNVKQTNEISSLETKVAEIEKEKEKQHEELSSFKMTLEKLQGEKKALEDDIKNRDNEILLLKENVSRLVQERESYVRNAVKQDEEFSGLKINTTKLQDDKIALEDEVRKRHSEILSLNEQVSKRLEEKDSYKQNTVKMEEELSELRFSTTKLQEELSVMKISVGNLTERNKVLEEDILRRDNDLLLQETRVGELEKDKGSLVNDIAKKDEEILAMKITVENLHAEKTAVEDHNISRVNEISSIQTTLLQLQDRNESLVNDIAQNDEEVSAMKNALENLQNEKEAAEEHNNKRDNEMSLRETTLLDLRKEKECMVNEVALRNEELSLIKITVRKLQKENEFLEDVVAKRDNHISLQKTSIGGFEKEKECLVNDIAKKDEELSVIKVTVQKLTDDIVTKDEELSSIKVNLEKMQTETKHLEDYTVKCDNEISLFEEKISKLQDEKDALANNLVKQDVELSSFKVTVDELQNEKKAFEDEILKRDSGISLLESKVFSLEAEKETLSNDITRKDEQLSAFIENIEKLEEERNCLESKIAKGREEILSLRSNVDEITEVKRSFEVDIQKREQELLSINETLRSLQDENKFLENSEVELTEKLSHYTIKIEHYQEEISLLKTSLQKVTTEKENVESKMKEFNEKSKCDEEDFDKLITGYLQEIDSWKKRFGVVDDEMTVLRNEVERLQLEKQDLENVVNEMSESERTSEEKFQENIKMYHQDIDSWKVKVQDLESDAEILRKTVQNLEHECESKKLEMNRVNDEKEKNSKLYQEMVEKIQIEGENSEKEWILEKEKEVGNLRFELEAKLQTVESHFATKVKELDDRNVSMEQLKDNVSKLNNVLSKKDEEIINLKSKVVELEERTFQANSKVHEIQRQFDGKEHDLKLSMVCVEELRDEARKLTEIISEKEENVFTLENEMKGLSKLNKELEESKLSFIRQQEKYKNELGTLQDMLKSFEAKELAAKHELKLMKNDVNRLQNELSAIQQQNSDDEKSIKNNIEKSREQLRVLLADIDETTKIKVSLEEELQVLQSKLEQHSEEKTKLEMDLFCLKEITEELTKGKMTLLEEIARLSDQKKEGQQLLDSEFSRLRISNSELQNNRERIEKENSELIVQISSLKVTLATVQSAYEQTQDEIKNHKMRFDEAIIREKQHNQEREKIDEKYQKTEVKLKYLEERNRSITVENKTLSSSFNETRKRLESLEKEIQTIKSENALLLERVKHQGSGDSEEGLDIGKSSTQTSALRKKLKEFRAKLSEEKKQRELHEFEIKNLKEKVERFTKTEKENEAQLEDTRKKFLEVKTERDGLLMDLDSLNKRKKKDMEGYASTIEALEDELR